MCFFLAGKMQWEKEGECVGVYKCHLCGPRQRIMGTGNFIFTRGFPVAVLSKCSESGQGARYDANGGKIHDVSGTVAQNII